MTKKWGFYALQLVVILSAVFIGALVAAGQVDKANTLGVDSGCGCSWTANGRVVDKYGRAISRTRIELVDMYANVEVRYTNTFGYFKFEDIDLDTYVLIVTAPRRNGYFVGVISPITGPLPPYRIVLDRDGPGHMESIGIEEDDFK